MKLRNLFAGMILCLAVASCIQDEAQNVEAAIDGCSGNHIQQYLIDRNDFTVQLYVSKAADPSKININFDLPTGASIKPVRQLTGDETNVYNFNDETLENLKLHQKMMLFLQPIQSNFGKQKCLWYTILRL